jgi:hypothetical protein
MGTIPHSDDLRSRVVAEILAGSSRRQAAKRFKVSAASAVRWAQLHDQTGGVSPRPRGGKSRSPLELHAAWLLDLIIWPDPSLRPTSTIAQRLVRASYCVIDTPIVLTAGVIASIEACDAGVSSGPVRPARRAQPARHRSSAAARL